ncbi:class F sortase [Flexivirga alba]|uniref:Class F sortase n=1 Tax=Flexivirga alba TaxID=702742 RepID=A0ABW2ADJ1_9MICO
MGRHSSRRTKGTIAIVAGAAVAIAGGVVLVNGLNHDDSTDPPISAIGTSSPGASTSSQHPSTSHSSSKATGKHSGTSSGSSDKATTVAKPTSNSTPASVANPAGAACIPKSLTVSSVGIGDEQVVPMGTNSQGQIYPPAHTTMWYNRSAQPGQNGISVIAGHVTYDGPDNFYNLRNVPIGAKVSVTCTNNKVVRLQVTHTASVLKTKLTTDQRVWGGSATPVVTLVTCDIDSPMIAGHHLNNYVVWTRPA